MQDLTPCLYDPLSLLVSKQEIVKELKRLSDAGRTQKLSPEDASALRAMWFAVYALGQSVGVIGPSASRELLELGITAMAFSGGGNHEVRTSSSATGPKLPTTVGARSAITGRTFGGQSIDELAQAAAAVDRGGLSIAGRALQKHGNREGSTFPSAEGNPVAINAQAQQVVMEILNNPATTVNYRNTGRFGKVADIVSPDGRGLRYDSKGKLIGFLEPPKK